MCQGELLWLTNETINGYSLNSELINSKIDIETSFETPRTPYNLFHRVQAYHSREYVIKRPQIFHRDI